MPDEHPFATLPDTQHQVVRPCTNCRKPVTFSGQPGDGKCEACGVRQYLTGPSRQWPEGATGRYPSEDGRRPA